MHTRISFGKELKERVGCEEDIREIGAWAYEVYMDGTPDNDAEFINILLILNMMDDGPEFALCYKRLNEIADDLIAGKRNINMSY